MSLVETLTTNNGLPEKLLSEWHPTKNNGINPNELTIGSYEYIWWKCSEGHEWGMSIYDRQKKKECPKCLRIRKATKRAEIKEERRIKTLQEVDPELAKQWHPTKNEGITPDAVVFDEGWVRRWWQCKRNHEWEETIASRYINTSVCPYCANKKVCEDNCLATVYPEIAKNWFVLKNSRYSEVRTAYDVIYTSSEDAYWICEKGHTWRETISQRVKNGKGCRKCELFQNSLALLDPELVKEWHPTKNEGEYGVKPPEETRINSSQNVWWLCGTCGNEYKAQVGARHRREIKCKVCHPLQPKGRTAVQKRRGNFEVYNAMEDRRVIFENQLKEKIKRKENE
ncbi:zinc-ribbon domain-containing protein [Bacillus bingmayongensis]|uniref:zinc-ribbon domain-containing protein n=1 Tax=Bacillus bingmayongensis TaxID=1150157 RepID=UPI001C8D6209|nr:zinc-ribbon domain-containing protein [Bacillus bingmayongensis]MBY0598818.1 zinc-ribbon domain-containing protein [Bacillus bingmayongensis]